MLLPAKEFVNLAMKLLRSMPIVKWDPPNIRNWLDFVCLQKHECESGRIAVCEFSFYWVVENDFILNISSVSFECIAFPLVEIKI